MNFQFQLFDYSSITLVFVARLLTVDNVCCLSSENLPITQAVSSARDAYR